MRKTARDRMEPCPHCATGRLTRTADNARVEVFDCGTSRVDGELRVGTNCEQYVMNVREAEMLRANIAAREANPE
jgi:hypothetical protein